MWHEWGKSANKFLERKSEGNKERLDRPGDNSERTEQHLRRDLLKTLVSGKVSDYMSYRSSMPDRGWAHFLQTVQNSWNQPPISG